MSGSVVTIRINGQPYQLGCDKGQEAEIEAYGKKVNDMVASLANSVGQIGDARLLVMASILLAEQAAGQATGEAHKPQSDSGDIGTPEQIEKLEKLAKTISALAASLKSA